MNDALAVQNKIRDEIREEDRLMNDKITGEVAAVKNNLACAFVEANVTAKADIAQVYYELRRKENVELAVEATDEDVKRYLEAMGLN